jgi:hypothetical protein
VSLDDGGSSDSPCSELVKLFDMRLDAPTIPKLRGFCTRELAEQGGVN